LENTDFKVGFKDGRKQGKHIKTHTNILAKRVQTGKEFNT
jgi:hypothetical protein